MNKRLQRWRVETYHGHGGGSKRAAQDEAARLRAAGKSARASFDDGWVVLVPRDVKQAAEAGMTPEALKRIRAELGLTQEALANELGVQPLAVARWESGSVPISKSRAVAIRAIGVRLSASKGM